MSVVCIQLQKVAILLRITYLVLTNGSVHIFTAIILLSFQNMHSFWYLYIKFALHILDTGKD